jgi:hypothetical protein
MTAETEFFNVSTETDIEDVNKKAAANSIQRIARFTLVRLVSLVITVIIGVYLTILIANMGGKVDEIMQGEIRERITLTVTMNPANQNLSTEVRVTSSSIPKSPTKKSAWASTSLLRYAACASWAMP